MQGFMVASYDLGCLIGAILCFCFANITGRRWTIAIGCVVLLIGAALQTSAYSVAHFIGTTESQMLRGLSTNSP